jgi:hypothetical protein
MQHCCTMGYITMATKVANPPRNSVKNLELRRSFFAPDPSSLKCRPNAEFATLLLILSESVMVERGKQRKLKDRATIFFQRKKSRL